MVEMSEMVQVIRFPMLIVAEVGSRKSEVGG
jgi:hypothetical protein